MNPDKDEAVSTAALMATIREEADRRRGGPLDAGDGDDPGPGPQPQEAPGTAVPPQAAPRLRVSDFLPLQGEAFVQQAYTRILGRAPDPKGLKHYIALLNSGRVSKMEILGRLRFSSEGRRRGVPVRGLGWRYPLQLAYRLPLMGYALRVGTAVANLPAVYRHLRQLEQTVAAEQAARKDIVTGFEKRLAGQARELEEALIAVQTEVAACERGTGLKLERFEDQVGQWKAALRQWERLQEQVLSDHDVRLTRVEERVVEELAALHRQQERTARDLAGLEAGLKETGEVFAQRCQALSGGMDALDERLAGGRQALEARAAELAREVNGLKAWVTLQEGRLARLWEGRGLARPVPAAAAEVPPGRDALYAAYEARFRGSRAEVTQNLRFYLPLVKAAGAATSERPLLDLGCGRGEWLELLGAEGLVARGVDLNPVMITESQKRGLPVSRAEVLAYLATLKDASLGAVTCFHLLEHLGLDVQLSLLDEVLRVLKPGGLFVLESPNPENLVVGSCSFYLDPTHVRPLPPRTAHFFMEARGFAGVEMRPLHPCRPEGEAGREALPDPAAHFFYGPQDYAVWGYKPGDSM